jgi:hypothetical protein
VQQRRLVSVFNDFNIKPFQKCERYMLDVRSTLGLSYVALSAISHNQWLQTDITCSGATVSLPSPAHEIDEFSVARQMSEILLDDATACMAQYSAAAGYALALACRAYSHSTSAVYAYAYVGMH